MSASEDDRRAWLAALEAELARREGRVTGEASEEAKRRLHPLDMWDNLVQHCAEGRFQKGDDVLSFKYQGLFFVAPAQTSYMCRLRLPGGVLDSHQFLDGK